MEGQMAEDLLDHVLTIEETKLRMKDIRDRAVHQRAVVRFGDRGRDEMVIVSSALWNEVNSRKQEEMAGRVPTASAFAAFDHLLQERPGALAKPLPRRRMPGLKDTSDLTVAEMARLGEDTARPRRRRSR
jgi:hypothetical protein